MSDSATDRPEFRQAINEAIGWDDRKKVASIYQEHGGRVTELATDYEALLAIALWGAETALTYADHAGLLVTPAHDAEVAAKALREAADDVHHIDPEWESALWITDHRKVRGGVYVPVPVWLRERADRIEASHE